MKQKLFDALSLLMDTTEAHDYPTLFSFVKNEIESIIYELDQLDELKDINTAKKAIDKEMMRYNLNTIVYYKDIFSIFHETHTKGFDMFLLDNYITIDGDRKNGTVFDEAIRSFVNYAVESEVRSFFRSFF